MPPRILKKPFPKDERAFFEPKPFSSMVALTDSVAEGHKGGFSLVLLISSFIFWENNNNNKHSLNSLSVQYYDLKLQKDGKAEKNLFLC